MAEVMPKLAAETEMAQGLFPDSNCHCSGLQTSHCQAGCQTTASPTAGRNSHGAVLVSALPALLLPPETSCMHGPTARAASAGHRLLASHLMQLWRLWSYSLRDEIVPTSGK